MAGEVRGKIYEAISKVALELAIQGNENGLKVLWHEQPEWVTIEPDLSVGKDKNNLEALFLVTHSTSVKLYEKKFWRDIAELFQYKVQGKSPVQCYSIIFDNQVKPELSKVTDAFLDGKILIQNILNSEFVIEFIINNLKNFGKNDLAREETVKSLIDCDSNEFVPLFKEFIIDFSTNLKEILKTKNKQIIQIWPILKAIDRRPCKLRRTKITYVRNGLAKLIILDELFREITIRSIENSKEIEDRDVPQYALDLGLLTEDICGFKVDDKEILSAVNLLGEELCQKLIRKAPVRMQDFADPLRSAGNLDAYSNFVVDNYQSLCTPLGMENWLRACFEDPVGILPPQTKVDIPPRDTWLFIFCMTIEKAITGKILAYGLSKLAKETGFPSIGGADGGLKISPFIYRQKMLPDDMLKKISVVFSKKIKQLGKEKLASINFIREMKRMQIQRQFYILMVYRFFDPLSVLIKHYLKENDINFSEDYIPTSLREYSEAAAAKSKFIIVGNKVLIYWQSVTEAGRVHKTKELSARFRATKTMWDGTKFIKRTAAKHIYFVADGEWREEDFQMLIRSGVDRIFYSDEIEELIIQIQSDYQSKKEGPILSFTSEQ